MIINSGRRRHFDIINIWRYKYIHRREFHLCRALQNNEKYVHNI